MIVDTSALLAIFFDEPEAASFSRLILQDESPRISAANFLEACLKVDRDPTAEAQSYFEETFERLRLLIEPISVPQTHIAREANLKYGRGSGHPAKLNFGDCFAYALAKDRNERLLFKGNDFVHTDVKRAA